MRTKHEDKNLQPEAAKLSPAAQRALDAQLDRAQMTPAEENEVGYRAAQAADARVRSGWRADFNKAADLTIEEQVNLEEAVNAYEIADAEMRRLQETVLGAELDIHRQTELLGVLSYGGHRDKAGELALSRLQMRAAAAEREFELAVERRAVASRHLQRVRGQNNANGHVRQINHAREGF